MWDVDQMWALMCDADQMWEADQMYDADQIDGLLTLDVHLLADHALQPVDLCWPHRVHGPRLTDQSLQQITRH